MNYPEMNRMAWEIATLAMVRRGGGVTSYSTNQIRKFLSLAQVSDTELSCAIDEAVRSYTPQPALQFGGGPPSEKRELEERKEKNTLIGKKIQMAFAEMDPSLRTRFMQYLIWDIKILEEAFKVNRTDPIPFMRKLFSVEQLERQNELLESIKSLVKTSGKMDYHNAQRGKSMKFEPRGSGR